MFGRAGEYQPRCTGEYRPRCAGDFYARDLPVAWLLRRLLHRGRDRAGARAPDIRLRARKFARAGEYRQRTASGMIAHPRSPATLAPGRSAHGGPQARR